MDEDLIEQLRAAREEWAILNQVASLKEELKSHTLNVWKGELGDIADNRAEAQVKRSNRWRDYITDMIDARLAANQKWAFVVYLDKLIERQRSREATNRKERSGYGL